jgi:hypothetical protein
MALLISLLTVLIALALVGVLVRVANAMSECRFLAVRVAGFGVWFAGVCMAWEVVRFVVS